MALLAQGGIRPAQSFERPISLGDIEGTWDELVKAGKGAVKGVSAKADNLERSLIVITVLSGIAAITGIIGVIRR